MVFSFFVVDFCNIVCYYGHVVITLNKIDTSKFAVRFSDLLSNSEENTYTLSSKLGLTPATISRYTNGKMTPKLPTLYSIAEIFKVNPLWLMGDDTNREEVKKKKAVQIPVLGFVRAGIPMDAVEYIIDYEEISEELARQGEFFALQIKGDSMEPKISNGDVVIVRKQPDIENGEIAIVLVNGDEATIKKVQKFQWGINLIPSNPAYDVRAYTNEQIESLPVQILGKVVELRAKF